MLPRLARTFALCLCAILALLPLTPAVTTHVAAQPSPSIIAYTRADTYDEIRLINADGTNDRPLWAHGLPDPHGVYGIYNMAWRPDGTELAFASTHENWCSINYSDVFGIAPDGNGYRRITQAPACGDLANYPKGTVEVPVRNNSFVGNSFTGFIYFQGAPSLLPVSLPAGGTTVLTFHDVADFGAEFLQIGGVINGANREYNVGTAIDVQSGGTVRTATLNIYTPQNLGQEPRSPTWRSDGASLGYAYGYNALYGITTDPDPVEFGRRLVNPRTGPSFVEYMAYGPAPAHTSHILYQGYDAGDGIYLVTEGSTTAGERLVTTEFETIRSLAWLPDGSGFVYAVEEIDESYEPMRANLFEYTFATRQAQRLTNFTSAFAGQLSLSPDGKEIVFEHAVTKDATSSDLWLVDRVGGSPRLLIANAGAPAWRPNVPLLPSTATPISSPTSIATTLPTSTPAVATSQATSTRTTLPTLTPAPITAQPTTTRTATVPSPTRTPTAQPTARGGGSFRVHLPLVRR